MNSTLLHWVGDQVRNLCLQIPMEAVRGAFIAVPIVLMVWVILLPNSRTTPPGRPYAMHENLKLWAWLALMFQVVVYSVF